MKTMREMMNLFEDIDSTTDYSHLDDKELYNEYRDTLRHYHQLERNGLLDDKTANELKALETALHRRWDNESDSSDES